MPAGYPFDSRTLQLYGQHSYKAFQFYLADGQIGGRRGSRSFPAHHKE